MDAERNYAGSEEAKDSNVAGTQREQETGVG